MSGDLIGNKITNKITNVSRTSPQNSSRTVESETEIPKEIYIYISPEKRRKLIDDLRLIQ